MAVQLIWKELFGDDRNMEGEMVVPRGRSGEEDMTEHVLITKVSLTVNTEGVFRCCVIRKNIG